MARGNLPRFNKRLCLLIQFLWMFFVIINIIWSINNSVLGFQEIDKWLVISFLGLIWYIFSHYLISDKFFSPYNVFMILSFFFHFGQVAVWRMGLIFDPYNLLMVNQFPLDQITDALIFSTASLALLHMGAILNLLFVSYRKQVRINNSKDEINLYAIRITGYILLIISILPLVMYDGAYFKAAIQNGYLSIYNLEINYGLWDDLSRLVKPAIIFLMIGYKNNKRVSNFIFIVALIYSLLKMFLIGQRGYEMVFIISLVWARNLGINPIKGSKAILYSCYTFILLILMRVIAETRGISKGNTVNLKFMIEKSLKENPIVSSIAEFGSTLTTPIVAMRHIPNDISFAYGSTYLKSLFTIFPNVKGLFNPIISDATPASVLGEYASALGGSFIAEFYYNFGWFGMLLGVILGFVISHFSNMAYKSKNPIMVINSAVFLSILLWFIRDSFSYIPRATFMYILFPGIIWRFSYDFIKKNSRVKEG